MFRGKAPRWDSFKTSPTRPTKSNYIISKRHLHVHLFYCDYFKLFSPFNLYCFRTLHTDISTSKGLWTQISTKPYHFPKEISVVKLFMRRRKTKLTFFFIRGSFTEQNHVQHVFFKKNKKKTIKKSSSHQKK